MKLKKFEGMKIEFQRINNQSTKCKRIPNVYSGSDNQCGPESCLGGFQAFHLDLEENLGDTLI